MEWNEINFDLLYDTLALHNMLGLETANAMEEGDFDDEMWSDLEESLHNTLQEYVNDVLGDNSMHFYKAFRSRAEALEWISDLTDCCLNSIDEDRLIDFIPKIRHVTFLSHSKGIKVRVAA